MIQVGKIQSIQIEPSGYGCCMGLLLYDVGTLYCYVPIVTYKEPDIITNEINVLNHSTEEELILRVDDEIKVQLKVVFVTSYEIVGNDYKLGFKQPIQGSSHTTFIAVINEMIDDYTLICSIDGLNTNILVEFEIKALNLTISDKIGFSGEFSLSIIG